MARTDAGAVLTVEHRDAQLRLRAQALRGYLRLWPLWQGDDQTFEALVTATLPLVRAHHRLSSSFAAAYYESFRRAERVGGDPTPRLAAPVIAERVAASLHVTGRVAVRKAILAGHSPQAAMQTALTSTSGAVTRHVLDGGRETLLLTVREDRQAQGWARVTSGRCCAFCATLASRGAVYKDDTAGFRAHDHCACSAEPTYGGSALPPASQRFREMYDQAKREDPANPTNGFRRLLEAA